MIKILKKIQYKSYVAGLLTATIIFASSTVFANTGGVMRELFYGVSINLNGQVLQLADIDRPFIIDGRTFLPVRAISEALDIPIEWHGATRTVYVGIIPHGAPFWTTVPAFERNGTGNFTVGLGSVHMLGQPFANAIHIPTHFNPGQTLWSNHSLNAQYRTLTGIIGRIDARRETSTISFIGDGRELASFTVDESTLPYEVSVDVSGILVLRIEISGSGGRSIAFANAMIQ